MTARSEQDHAIGPQAADVARYSCRKAIRAKPQALSCAKTLQTGRCGAGLEFDYWHHARVTK
ncbi:MAG: hypothetical protein J0H25_14940 [Rhizobiales bacterium]|nr:hypothetical protein [Hyphomicrobiales bacterium]